MSPMARDRVEKQLFIRASKDRVWRALTDAAEFGAWFGMSLDGPFVPGRRTKGHVTRTEYKGVALEVQVERMDAETLFSFRWHPHPVDPKVDYSKQPTTLVEFHLEEGKGGTLLKLVESGFDRLPAVSRDEAFRAHDGGWLKTMGNLASHIAA